MSPDVAPILQTAFSFWSSKVLLTAVELGQRQRGQFLGADFDQEIARAHAEAPAGAGAPPSSMGKPSASRLS